MTGRIKVIRKKTVIIDGRRQQEASVFYECWCKVQDLMTSEKYSALQIGLENTIVFKVRNCREIEEIRLNLKEFYVEYKGTEFKVYSASPMVTDSRRALLKCRDGA